MSDDVFTGLRYEILRVSIVSPARVIFATLDEAKRAADRVGADEIVECVGCVFPDYTGRVIRRRDGGWCDVPRELLGSDWLAMTEGCSVYRGQA